jgi:hypothetical protein
VNEPFADRALEDPRVRQPGEGVAIGEEPQLGEQGSAPALIAGPVASAARMIGT